MQHTETHDCAVMLNSNSANVFMTIQMIGINWLMSQKLAILIQQSNHFNCYSLLSNQFEVRMINRNLSFSLPTAHQEYHCFNMHLIAHKILVPKNFLIGSCILCRNLCLAHWFQQKLIGVSVSGLHTQLPLLRDLEKLMSGFSK